MAFVKKAVDGVKAPVAAVRRNPWVLIGLLVVVLIAFRFRGQIMAALNKIPLIGTGANKLSGEG